VSAGHEERQRQLGTLHRELSRQLNSAARILDGERMAFQVGLGLPSDVEPTRLIRDHVRGAVESYNERLGCSPDTAWAWRESVVSLVDVCLDWTLYAMTAENRARIAEEQRVAGPWIEPETP